MQKTFEAGVRPTAVMGDWLKWAEVNLDLPANVGVNEQWLTGQDAFLQGTQGYDEGKYPYMRISGTNPFLQEQNVRYSLLAGMDPSMAA